MVGSRHRRGARRGYSEEQHANDTAFVAPIFGASSAAASPRFTREIATSRPRRRRDSSRAPSVTERSVARAGRRRRPDAAEAGPARRPPRRGPDAAPRRGQGESRRAPRSAAAAVAAAAWNAAVRRRLGARRAGGGYATPPGSAAPGAAVAEGWRLRLRVRTFGFALNSESRVDRMPRSVQGPGVPRAGCTDGAGWARTGRDRHTCVTRVGTAAGPRSMTL